MARVVLMSAVLLASSGCRHSAELAERAEVEALVVESRALHAAIVAGHERNVAGVAERGAAHVAAAEARAATGAPLCVDIDTRTRNVARSVASWETPLARVNTRRADTLANLDDAGHVGCPCPISSGSGSDATRDRGDNPRGGPDRTGQGAPSRRGPRGRRGGGSRCGGTGGAD